ncbi:MAG: hypothetical protein JXA71_13600 [Chitinispirillaceae bacterium]|nr:hypothetical protein [Chitinispirillaceae bacterium]
MLALCSASLPGAEEYSFEIPEDKDDGKLEWSGNLDGKYSVLRMQTSSPLYRLQFMGQDLVSEWLSQYRLDLYMNADYQTKDMGFHVKTHGTHYNDAGTVFELFEAYGNWNLSINSFVQAGKKRYNWGKGYAFNPVGYVNPRKEPENPELAQAGILSFNFETVKSFQFNGLKTFALTGVVIPPRDLINNRYGQIKNTDIAVKSYLLMWNIDIDVMGYYSRINPMRIGADFSTNVKENIEIHGEASYFNDASKHAIDNNALLRTAMNGCSYLMGFRYLNKWNTTIIAEYYHNDAGLTQTEYESYVAFIQNSVNSPNEDLQKKALSYSKMYFNGSTKLQDYAYLKISQPEPFNLLYFTPSVFTIVNINDHSLQMALSLSYKPVADFELLIWPTLLLGDDGTEFGSKQVQQLLDVWMRVYF